MNKTKKSEILLNPFEFVHCNIDNGNELPPTLSIAPNL